MRSVSVRSENSGVWCGVRLLRLLRTPRLRVFCPLQVRSKTSQGEFKNLSVTRSETQGIMSERSSMEALELSFELGQMLHGLRGAINAVETLERTHRTGEAEDATKLAAEEGSSDREKLDAAWERVLDAGEDEQSALEDANAYEDESLRGARELLDKVAMEEEFVPEPEEEEEEFVRRRRRRAQRRALTARRAMR